MRAAAAARKFGGRSVEVKKRKWSCYWRWTTRRSSSSLSAAASSSSWTPETLTLITLLVILSSCGINSHWINLHVWYEDPLLNGAPTDSPRLLSSSSSSSHNNTPLINGMQQDSAAAAGLESSSASSSSSSSSAMALVEEKQLPPCQQLSGLTQSQIDICLVFRDHMKAIVQGAKLGLSECRFQFRYNHWNCSSPPNLSEQLQLFSSTTTSTTSTSSTALNNNSFTGTAHNNNNGNNVHILPTSTNHNKGKGKGKNKKSKQKQNQEKGGNNNKKRSVLWSTVELQEKLNKQFNSVWNSILKQGSKEVAFAHAVWSAAVTQSIAKACRDGSLTSCSCGRTPRPTDLKREWRWGGCGDNLQYGYKFASDFVDSREKGAIDSKIRAKSLVNLHNNEAGRRAVLRKTKIACKCHGVSGSCALVTCWHQTPSFREIGDHLMDAYSKATLVKMNKRGRLQVKRAGVKVPSVHDLLYVENSPNYCVANSSLGIFGQSGRHCNPNPGGADDESRPDSCKNLCCNRGFSTSIIRSTTRCNCKFVWCCEIKCDECKQVQKVSSCN